MAVRDWQSLCKKIQKFNTKYPEAGAVCMAVICNRFVYTGSEETGKFAALPSVQNLYRSALLGTLQQGAQEESNNDPQGGERLDNMLKVHVFDMDTDMLRSILSHAAAPPRAIGEKVYHERAITNCQKVKSSSETGLAAVLAEHLFSQLTPEHSYFIDENVSRKLERFQCPCGLDECKKSVRFGNTAIGSSRVWHGYPDIFIDKKVPVTIVNDARDDSKEEDTTVEDDTETGSSFMAPAAKKMKKDSEEAKSSSAGSSFGLCIEMKNKKSGDALLCMSIVDQIIAEAITNAFAQVNANSVLKGLMIPSFGCTQDHIVVFLYDPENDILLQTNLINLFEVPGELSVIAIIEVWMYLNFAVLFKHDIAKKYKFESAKFRESVKDYLCYYEQASYQERLAPSESGYFREVVVPRMFRISDHVEKNDIK